ncbi:hypothetical protein ACOSQ2_033252 [Xanthoceras sorbifolium]
MTFTRTQLVFGGFLLPPSFASGPVPRGPDPHKGGGSRLNISAIGRNLARIRTLEQCPLCKEPCTLDGLRRIYGYSLPDEDLQQRYQSLEVEHENLKWERNNLLEENRRLRQHRSIVS